MLTRQNLGWRHKGGLAAGLDDGCGGKKRHHSLAGADVTMQQAQHAIGLREVGNNVVDGALLRGRKRIGQGRNNPRAQKSLGGAAAAGPRAHVAAQERQRELAGKQFVVGKPRPRCAGRFKVGRLSRVMHAAQRFGEAWKAIALEPGGVLPFRELGQAMKRQIERLAQLVRVQPFGERIDRIDQRQPGKARRIDHAVGMHHLQMAIVERCYARNVARLALGEELLQIILARVEISDGERVGVVAGRRCCTARAGGWAAAAGDDRR